MSKSLLTLLSLAAMAGAGFYFLTSSDSRGTAGSSSTQTLTPTEITEAGKAKTAGKAAGEAAQDSPAEIDAPETAANTAGADLSQGEKAHLRLVPWPHENSDIAPAEGVTYGYLPNGLRYIVMPNQEPPGRVSLRLHIDAGSLMEADDQRGVAHFLEHMVFNGSENFTPDELIPQMQRLGIGFGAHANAYTSFDETVYMLNLPNLEESTLDLGYTVMRDFADGALLKEEEIDKERGVILSEKNARDSVQMRIMHEQFKTILPNFLATNRFPIGTEEVIKSAPRERFTDFYERYYNPSRMTFIVVGDITVGDAVARLTESFSSMEDPAEPGAQPKLGSVAPAEGTPALTSLVFADSEVASDDISYMLIRAAHNENDTVAARARRLPLALANAMLGQRFSRLSKKEGSPILSGSASRSQMFDAVEFGSIDVNPAPDKWQEAVAVLEQEHRRVLEHGFTTAEFTEIKAIVLNQYEQLVKRAPSRKSAQLATQFVNSINKARVVASPEEELAVMKKGLEEVTPEKCHQFFTAFWKSKHKTLALTTKEDTPETQALLADLFKKSQAVAVAPLEEEGASEFAYTDFGDEGTVTSRTEVEGLDFTQVTLSNEIRFNIKRTDFVKNSVSVQARFGGGLLTLPEGKPGLGSLAGTLLNAGGLGKHSTDELERLLAGKNVGVGFGAGEDAFQLSGGTTPADLELQLQLMCAQLMDAGYRPEALRAYQKGLPAMYKTMKHSLQGAATEMSAWMRGNDDRYRVPTMEKALAYTPEEVRDWLEPAFKKSYLELSIVGDIDPEVALKLVQKTFGALPQRATEKALYAERRVMSLPKTPDSKSFTYDSKIPRCVSLVLWKTRGIKKDLTEVRRLNILTEILSNRLSEKIREEIGATYSPSANVDMSMVFPDYGGVIANAVVKPEDSKLVEDLIVEIGSKMAKEGVTADELDRALKPTLSNLQESLRSNGYWLSTVLGQSQEQPHRLDWARERDTDYGSITLEDMNGLAKKYFTEENAIRVELVPVPLP